MLFAAVFGNPPVAHAESDESSMQLALEFFKQLEPNGRSIVLSPYGVRTAFAVLFIGARSKTASEIASALYLNPSPEATLEDEKKLRTLLQEAGQKEGVSLSIANSLWVQTGYDFLESYTKRIQDSFAAELKQADFTKDPEAARTQINTWVSSATQEKIKQLVDMGVLSNLTRMVIANAVHFKGHWNVQFDPAHTAPGPFWLDPENKRQVPIMHLKSRLAVGIGKPEQDENFDMLELPYKGREMSMIIVLPKLGLSLPRFESRITAREIMRMQKRLRPMMVSVSLPKFSMDWGASIVPAVQRLGIKTVFASNADLSGIDGSKLLMLSDVLHKATVDVSEEGTEASAATALVVQLKSAAKELEFKVDRPFLFFVKLNATDTVLFAGRVAVIRQ